MIFNTETLVNYASKAIDGVILAADKIRNSESVKKIAVSAASAVVAVFAKRKAEEAMDKAAKKTADEKEVKVESTEVSNV